MTGRDGTGMKGIEMTGNEMLVRNGGRVKTATSDLNRLRWAQLELPDKRRGGLMNESERSWKPE